jgi:hypothetical protein
MIKTEAARSIFLVALCSLLIGAYAVADAPKQAINIPAGLSTPRFSCSPSKPEPISSSDPSR